MVSSLRVPLRQKYSAWRWCRTCKDNEHELALAKLMDFGEERGLPAEQLDDPNSCSQYHQCMEQ